MIDLISRQAVIEHVKKRLYETAFHNMRYEVSQYYMEMADNRVDVWIGEVPSVAAERVVRCRDCKYSDECNKRISYSRRDSSPNILLGSEPVEYCSNGKRKYVPRVTVRRKKGYHEKQVRQREDHGKWHHL